MNNLDGRSFPLPRPERQDIISATTTSRKDQLHSDLASCLRDERSCEVQLQPFALSTVTGYDLRDDKMSVPVSDNVSLRQDHMKIIALSHHPNPWPCPELQGPPVMTRRAQSRCAVTTISHLPDPLQQASHIFCSLPHDYPRGPALPDSHPGGVPCLGLPKACRPAGQLLIEQGSPCSRQPQTPKCPF